MADSFDERWTRGPADHGSVHQSEAAVRQVTWTEYVEPQLLDLRWSGVAVLCSRVALALWAIALVVAAALLRLDVVDETVSTTTVSRLGLVGVLVASVAAAIGWSWSDRATRNAHRLEARLPLRVRAVTAWASPLVWVVVLLAMMTRLEPTEVFDVRPVVVGAVLGAALWRPYSLVRRILKSLIRIDSDLAIASGYLLEVALFGLVWARLVTLPSELGPTNVGVAGSLLGLGAVAAIAAGLNVGVWYLVVRDVARAVDHRRVAMRTRHEHRQLRLAGIDPLDPKVRLALLMIHQEERRAELERADMGKTEGDVGLPPDAGLEPSVPDQEGAGEIDRLVIAGDRVDSLPDDDQHDVDEVGATTAPSGHSVEEAPVEVAPLEVAPLEEVTVEEVTVEEVTVDEVTVDEVTVDEVTVDEVTVDEVSGDAGQTARDDDEVSGEVTVSETDQDAAPRDPADRIAARFRHDHEGAAPGDRDDAGRRSAGSPSAGAGGEDLAAGNHPAVAESLGDRVAARIDRGGSEHPADRLDRLTRRLGSESLGRDERSLLDRLERFGIAAGGSVVPDDRVEQTPSSGNVTDLVIDRLYSLELVRYLLVLATIICAGASVWFVARSVSVGDLIDGTIARSDLDRLEVARIAAVRALAVVLALVPLWCAVAAKWANRVDLDVPGAARCAVLTAVSAVFVGGGFVADPASNVTLFTMLGSLGAALWSVPVMVEIERKLGRSTTIPSLVPLALGCSVLVAWAGRLLRPMTATGSVEAMSFFGGMLALVVAMAAVVTTVSSGDVVEAIRLSPATSSHLSAPAERAG